MIKTLLLSSLVLCGCLHGQYRVTVAGSGNKQAFIAENPSSGVNGSCYDLRTVDPGTGILHDAGQMCGLFTLLATRMLASPLRPSPAIAFFSPTPPSEVPA